MSAFPPDLGFEDVDDPAEHGQGPGDRGRDPRQGAGPNGQAGAAPGPEPGFDLARFNAKLLVGTAPPIRWLIKGTFRLGELSLLAAMGAAGKSFLLLALALELIRPKRRGMLFNNPILGGEVEAAGNVILFCAEDTRDEVWRRLEQLDPGGETRDGSPYNLYVVTVPDMPQSVHIVRTKGREVTLDKGLTFIEQVIDQVPDLVMVAVDPIQPFVLADLNQSAEAVQVCFNALSRLAASCGAAVILAHHMRKNGAREIGSAEEAREAIRGSGDIVNRPRLSYALWPASKEEETKIAKLLGVKPGRNLVFFGAVVKANGQHNRDIQTYVRGDGGVLVDRTAALRSARAPTKETAEALVEGIKTACANGRPFMRGGQAGLYARRSELPGEFHDMGRDRLEGIATDLLNSRRLVQAICGGTVPRWLDVPDGPFARGEGEFAEGAPTGKAGRKGWGGVL